MGMDNINPAMLTGLALGAVMGARQGSARMPQQQAPEPAPQPSKVPAAESILSDMQQTGGQQGVASTFLTGPQGVDQKTVKTTKPTLYGT